MNRSIKVVGLALACGACSVKSPLPQGAAAYAIIPPEAPAPASDYVIGPLDKVKVTVFREPDLSLEEVTIDPTGKLPMPLLGTVTATGKTPDALARELERGLATYLVNPKVTVSVASITQRVIVEGHVEEAGVYDIRGNATLLEAIALAGSPTKTADLDQIYVFRRINGQVQGARFNLRTIRAGIDPDPAIIAGDRVVVGLDAVAAAWQDYANSAVFNVFRIIDDNN